MTDKFDQNRFRQCIADLSAMGLKVNSLAASPETIAQIESRGLLVETVLRGKTPSPEAQERMRKEGMGWGTVSTYFRTIGGIPLDVA